MCYLFALMSNFLNRGELSRFMQDTKADMMEKWAIYRLLTQRMKGN